MKGCLIFALVALLLIFGAIGFCTFNVYKGFKDFPDYAREEVVQKKYKDLLNSIDECVANSDTALSFAAKLEEMAKPEELIYLALQKTGKEDFSSDQENIIEITKKFDGGSTSTVIINGYGYGRINSKEIIIIEYEINKFEDVEHCIIYLEHKKKESMQADPDTAL